MKKIIVPVDFSVFSEYAAKTAALLAHKHDADITLVHMLELPQGYSDHDSDYGQSLVFMIKYAEKKMQEFVSKDFFTGVKINVIIKHFRVFYELGEVAKDLDADLIIMGSHGTSEMEDYIVGSNTEKVVRSSNLPVLVIKDEINTVDFRNSVFVSDFKLESVNAYKKAQKLFRALNIKTKLLFVNRPDEGFVSTKEMHQRFEAFLMEADGDLKELGQFENYDDYSVEKGLYYYAERNNISLISIATHGRTSISKFFNKSISLDIANKAHYPVLTFLI
ncbi:universal stress protein [Flavobacteriaceae bacterium]|nr:universal stress protein [Flavobacteriaceae bacterium]